MLLNLPQRLDKFLLLNLPHFELCPPGISLSRFSESSFDFYLKRTRSPFNEILKLKFYNGIFSVLQQLNLVTHRGRTTIVKLKLKYEIIHEIGTHSNFKRYYGWAGTYNPDNETLKYLRNYRKNLKEIQDRKPKFL